MVDTPSWWQELGKIPEVGNFQELAQKIQASFKLSQQMSKIHNIENYYLAPLVPKCLCWKDFLSLPDPMFPCQDIWEEQLEKTIAYALALQYWVEKSNPPMLGQPCLLVRCVLKLREMMEQYGSFSDDTILDGVALLEGFLKGRTELTVPRDALPTFTDVPTEEVAVVETAPIGWPLEELTKPQVPHEEQTNIGASRNQFPDWRKVLHPSQPVTTAGQASITLSKSRWRHHNWSSGERRALCQRAEEHLQVEWAE